MNSIKDLRDFDSLYELIEYFDTEERCIDYLAKVRWWDEPICPHCGKQGAYEINTKGRKKRWKCKDRYCYKVFSVRVGTIFHDSKIPLRKWFIAIFLFTSHKKGISSHQLAKDIKITQKSAWYVLQRIRKTFEPHPDEILGFDKIVEVDETFVGGKASNKHKIYRTGRSREAHLNTKIPVFGK